MNLPRIFHPSSLNLEDKVQLSNEAGRHLQKVLRLKVGNPIILFNGLGGEYYAEICAIENSNVIATIKQFFDVNRESRVKIHLGQGISRGEKMDYTIQKSVELGVSQISPLYTERCGVHLDDTRAKKRIEHWQKVAISACEQSGRTSIPNINSPSLLVSWLNQIKLIAGELCFVCDPKTKQQLSNYASTSAAILVKSVTILIGPEGGLSENEIESAVKAGFHRLSLGPRILRTETAAIVVIALLQAHWGDFA